MNKNNGVIRFQATVAQVKTMADGGLRLSLDLSEKEIEAITKMIQAKQAGAILEIALLVIDSQKAKQTRHEDFVIEGFDFERMSQAFPELTITRES